MIALTIVAPLIATFLSTMPAPQSRNRRRKSRDRRSAPAEESRSSEAITIAWTVSVTGVVIADLMLVAAHFYARNSAEGQPARLLEGLLLVLASIMGAVSIALLPVVWRMRRLKPPQGYVAFSLLVAVAPLLAMLTRLLQ